MRIQTFDVIQQRQEEMRDQEYHERYPSADDPTLLLDKTRRQDPLFSWFSTMVHILELGSDRLTKLPEDAEWYDAVYTHTDAAVELRAGPTKKLTAFVLRNKPFDMSEPLRTRLVISETDEPDASLATNHPLLTVWAGPTGPFAGESPLLSDSNNPTGWQPVITEVFDEFGALLGK